MSLPGSAEKPLEYSCMYSTVQQPASEVLVRDSRLTSRSGEVNHRGRSLLLWGTCVKDVVGLILTCAESSELTEYTSLFRQRTIAALRHPINGALFAMDQTETGAYFKACLSGTP